LTSAVSTTFGVQDANGGILPGFGESLIVAVSLADVAVQPDPFTAIGALDDLTVPFELLYDPATGTAPLGAAITLQDFSTLETNTAPSFGITRLTVLPELLTVSFHFPEVVMVSVPCRLSVQPVMLGAPTAMLVLSLLVTVPVSLKLVHVTVMGTPFMLPTKTTFLDVPVTVVPGFKLAPAVAATPKTRAIEATVPMTAFLFNRFIPQFLLLTARHVVSSDVTIRDQHSVLSRTCSARR
jgi:hypothetical protein